MTGVQTCALPIYYLAHHAFGNEQAVGPGRIAETQYDSVWAQQAWDRTFTFFARKLG